MTNCSIQGYIELAISNSVIFVENESKLTKDDPIEKIHLSFLNKKINRRKFTSLIESAYFFPSMIEKTWRMIVRLLFFPRLDYRTNLWNKETRICSATSARLITQSTRTGTVLNEGGSPLVGTVVLRKSRVIFPLRERTPNAAGTNSITIMRLFVARGTVTWLVENFSAARDILKCSLWTGYFCYLATEGRGIIIARRIAKSWLIEWISSNRNVW